MNMKNFEHFYANVRVKDAEPIRERIEKMVSSATFNNWRNGTFEPDSRWWPQINAIAQDLGYDKVYSV